MKTEKTREDQKGWESIMKSILIIEDDLYIGSLLDDTLCREGYRTLRAYSGTEALLVLERNKVDLVLLDLMLPGLNGEDVLPKIKDIPVIILSAKTDVDHKADLLFGGAADYITKPFDTRELLARIAVQLRHPVSSSQTTVLRFDDLILHPDRRLVTIKDREIRLTRTEFAILRLLVQNPTQVIPKSRLLENIRDETPDCTESSLKTHISHIRSKLRALSGRDYIEAVWGIGFKMKDR